MASLRLRLALATAAVLLLALLVAGALLRHRTTHVVEHLQAEGRHARHRQIQGEVQAHWDEHRSWDGVVPTLRRIERLTGYEVGVVADGRLVAASQGAPGDLRTPLAPPPDLLVRDAGGGVAGGIVFLERRDTGGALAGAGERLRRSIAIVVAAVAVAGLLATALVTRSVTRPLAQLTAAVRAIAAGDRERRVRSARADEIGVLARAFDDLMDRLARQERLRRDMVSDVAHELRTPLHNLRGELEAAQDGLRPTDPALLASLLDEVTHLSWLVADLEQLALADAGQLRLSPAPTRLAPWVERAVAGCGSLARARGVTVRCSVAAELAVHADGERLVQVLRNLLDNAIAHSPEGGVVAVAAERRGARVAVTVSDQGPGIAAEHLPRVFDRFWRADASRSRATGGAGLGLAIVKLLVELQGGTVTVASRPGEGAAFTVELPAANA
jgi:signal transduction histidine kinase